MLPLHAPEAEASSLSKEYSGLRTQIKIIQTVQGFVVLAEEIGIGVFFKSEFLFPDKTTKPNPENRLTFYLTLNTAADFFLNCHHLHAIL